MGKGLEEVHHLVVHNSLFYFFVCFVLGVSGEEGKKEWKIEKKKEREERKKNLGNNERTGGKIRNNPF